MASNYFTRCGVHGRFTCSDKITPLAGEESTGEEWVVDDWDQRRRVDVHVPSVGQVDESFVFKAVEKFIDTLPPGVVEVWISDDGSLVKSNPPPKPREDAHSWVPLYPARTEFPEKVPTVRREELTECDRLGMQVDLVAYSPQPGETKTVVFKYNMAGTGVATMWHEANCVLRMPPHPNIVPFDALVVDSVDSVDSVVGFTTRYIPGGTLSENKDRVFKLKYLEQLLGAVDHLNLRLGIVHGDVCPWNLAIDAETDSIQLFDFNRAAKLGWEGDKKNGLAFRYDEARDDVKFVILTVRELITREFCSRLDVQPDELDVKKDWVPHQDAKLDSPVEEYKRVLDEWVKRWAEVGIDHFSKASEPLDWPPLVVDEFMRFDFTPPLKLGKPRVLMDTSGRKYLTWERPPTTSLPLPKGKRLLATGKVVADDGGEGNIGQGGSASRSTSGK